MARNSGNHRSVTITGAESIRPTVATHPLPVHSCPDRSITMNTHPAATGRQTSRSTTLFLFMFLSAAIAFGLSPAMSEAKGGKDDGAAAGQAMAGGNGHAASAKPDKPADAPAT